MEKNSSKDRGTVLWRFSQKFQFAADKIIPDSLVFCLILTFIVYVAALIFTDRGPVQLVLTGITMHGICLHSLCRCL